MKKLIKRVIIGSLLATASSYAVSVAVCAGCHGQNFEKKAMGKSLVVKDMSIKEIIAALKGYKAGTYGDTMKQMMMTQVIDVKDSDLEAMAMLIKINPGIQTEQATGFAATAAVAAAGVHIDLNERASDEMRIEQEDLGNRNTVSEVALGLRKTDLYSESKTYGNQADYDRPAPGSSTKFERAFKDAPPMIPHSVEGLLPITKMNNQCLGCHLPEVAPAVGSTPIPATHFTNYRPETKMKDGEVLKEGKIVGKELGNTSDIKIAKSHKADTLYQGRFNCTQCHAPQSKMQTAVANTFRPDFGNNSEKAHSSLLDHMNEGIE
ncbi:MAG: Nitrate reductase cytochrome c550-type subunit [uncultured Sulfurovum sp.]|uniref:Periplasmic nitrate reductase, electron transfer subunit n=1 Tax=uncultured Sulfurovum sp. TaxID=269237 RepID=A0A6S6SQB8_9BACT|nr:MAG: Nitrate reductase cytochrome c550-type subunit [uncultured Sulfurovum sp.]